jgi:hypothetical protein
MIAPRFFFFFGLVPSAQPPVNGFILSSAANLADHTHAFWSYSNTLVDARYTPAPRTPSLVV